MLVFILKNIFALVIFILGLVLFLLPGQGLVLMAVGVAIGSFPGKDYLRSKIIHNQTLQETLNFLRAKIGLGKFKFPE